MAWDCLCGCYSVFASVRFRFCICWHSARHLLACISFHFQHSITEHLYQRCNTTDRLIAWFSPCPTISSGSRLSVSRYAALWWPRCITMLCGRAKSIHRHRSDKARHPISNAGGGGTVERRWMPAERFDAPCMHRLIGDAAVTRPTGRDAATWPRRSAFPRRVDNMGDGTVFAPTSPSAAFWRCWPM